MDEKESTISATPVNLERKLAAILSADVKGYSRLMGTDDEATVRTLTARRTLMTTLIQQHRGRVVDSPGDNLLAEFVSVVDAVRCAVAIQQELQIQNAELPPSRQMAFRMGINPGDVLTEGGRLYGDGVNIAARLEGLAEAGGICLSGIAYDQVKNKLPFKYEYLGEREVKNIAEPVPVWRVVLEVPSPSVEQASSLPAAKMAAPPEGAVREAESSTFKVQGSKAKERRAGFARRKWLAMAVTGLVLIAILVAVRYFSFPFPNPQLLTPNTQPPLGTQDSALGTQEAPALPLPDKPSIVVLPFTNMSGDPEQEYFSDGITEDITADLSKLSGFFVIARNSAFTYKGKAVKIQEVSREMGVRYVLEGSVRKAGEQVRVTAQLIDGPSGGHVWSGRYDRRLTDIFAVQDEIVQQLVTTLRVEVQEAEQERVRRIPTNNLTAYDALLRAEEPFHRVTPEGVAQARPLYERAIALDPQYAAAYAQLGWTYWEEFHWNLDPQKLERAFALAQQAVALDGSLPAAHSLLSLIYQKRQQPEEAIAAGERAIAFDPNNANSAAWFGEVLNYEGRPAEAMGWLEKAVRLNPRYPFWYAIQLSASYDLTGRYAEAIATAKQALLRNPNEYAYGSLARSYVQQWIAQLDQDP